MSKYSEKCAAFAKGRKDGTEWRECWQAMASLVQGFLKYCGFPQGTLQIVPVDKQTEENTQYSLPGAIDFDLAVAERNGKMVVKCAWENAA